MNGLAAAVRRSAPGAQFFPSGVRFPCQLYVVIPADSESDLQAALDAVSEWGRKWRFTFSISPTKIRSHDLWPSDPHPSLCRHFGRLLSASCPPSRTFGTSGAVSVPSTQIPSLSGLATLGSSFPAPLSTLSAQSAPMSRLLGRSASVSSHCDTLIPLRGSSSSF